MFFAKTLVALTLAFYASALATPHLARNAHHHRSIAAHHVEPVVIAQPESVIVKPKRKRSLNKRCIPSSSANSTVVASSVLSSAAPASSSAPVNVGGAPPTFSSSIVVSVPAFTPSSTYVAPTSTYETPSSTYVAPPTSTYVAPTSTYVAPTSTYVPPSPTYTPTSTSSAAASGPTWLYETNTGDATFYAAGLGACGITNTDSDYIVAVSWQLFDNYPGYDGTNPNTNPVCNKQITANYQGKSVTVTVTDRCTGCDVTSLDFTPTAFQNMADLSVGRLYGMTWVWSS
ncbi:hypothetical protein IEO21_00042 [Rhodonia placenta]|uniref:RlpA-like protein double-psi beta-barrel domain-containing protein n=1 Tax=Rhodonia placenta TaxID=104341 RepID=A0A8H7PC48_9APHY|nr:hypothetical protein IEO21_00042 [Postia placenta]